MNDSGMNETKSHDEWDRQTHGFSEEVSMVKKRRQELQHLKINLMKKPTIRCLLNFLPKANLNHHFSTQCRGRIKCFIYCFIFSPNIIFQQIQVMQAMQLFSSPYHQPSPSIHPSIPSFINDVMSGTSRPQAIQGQSVAIADGFRFFRRSKRLKQFLGFFQQKPL